MERILLKVIQRYFPANRELFLDEKLKNGDDEKMQKKENRNGNAFCKGALNIK